MAEAPLQGDEDRYSFLRLEVLVSYLLRKEALRDAE